MALYSMTGFGEAHTVEDGVALKVEVRSVNHRFLDVATHLHPDVPRAWESIIREEANQRLARGRVDIYVDYRVEAEDRQRVRVDFPLARDYHRALQELSQIYDLSPDFSATQLAALPGVLQLEEVYRELGELQEVFRTVLGQALDETRVMRRQEGTRLSGELRRLLQQFEGYLQKVAAAVETIDQRRQESVLTRVEELVGSAGVVDRSHLAADVALIVQKASVVEEIARLGSHVEQFALVLDEEGVVGRKMEFLLQEMGRETNTLASKIGDAEHNEIAIQMKSVLEDMREQVRNVE